MASTDAWTGESPAVCTTAVTGPRAAASVASPSTADRSETSMRRPTAS